MKFLDFPSLALLSDSLTYESGEMKVNARLEAYSCKNVRQERRLWKKTEVGWKEEIEGVEELSISPELKSQSLISPFGPLDVKDSRHTHFLLVSTLNVAFPDYDFSKVKPERFERELGGAKAVLGSLSGVVWGGARADGDGSSPRSYGSYPAALHSFSPPGQHASLPNISHLSAPNTSSVTHPMLHKILNSVIELEDCTVYSYVPDMESDPHAEAEEEDLEDLEDFDIDGDVEMEESEDDGMMMSMDDEEYFSAKTGGHKRRSSDMSSPAKYGRTEGPMTPSVDQTIGRTGRSGGLLWSVYYFFYNKKQKRILFLSVWAKKRSFGMSPYLQPTTYIPRPVQVVQPSSSMSPSGSGQLHPPIFDLTKDDDIPNMMDVATSIANGSTDDSRPKPIRIGSTTSTASGMTAAQAALASFSAHGTPEPPSPAVTRSRRRERSNSASTVHSTGHAERLKDLAGAIRTGPGKRLKV